jgi:hypothetical protein
LNAEIRDIDFSPNTTDDARTMVDDMPPGLALEKFIADKFAALALSVPADDVEMMARFVEEDGIEREDKVEGAAPPARPPPPTDEHT